MFTENELIEKAQNILKKMVQGINPLTGQPIEANNFVLNEKMTRCFTFIADRLDNAKTPPDEFHITDEQKQAIFINDDQVGMASFSKYVNNVLNKNVSKMTSPAKLISSLKKLGALGDKTTSKGGRATITIEGSLDFGFETITRIVEGRSFQQVVANRKGQKYMIDNLENLMS